MVGTHQFDKSPYFSHGYVSKPVQDGLLPVHPLVLNVPATLRASTLISMSPRTEETSVDRCPPAASPRSSTGGWPGNSCSAPRGEQQFPSQLPRLHEPPDRCRVRPAAVARNLRLNSDSANDPCCSAQSWTLGHLRNGGVGTGPHGPGIPDPCRGWTNEATPYGESPEATRPDTEDAIRPDTDDTLTDTLAYLMDTLAHTTDTLAYRGHARAHRWGFGTGPEPRPRGERPNGQTPEAIRPDSRGHTARHHGLTTANAHKPHRLNPNPNGALTQFLTP